MDISTEITEILGRPESATLEYKSVLPPSKNIARLISSFANTDGGYIILGVSEDQSGRLEFTGLSQDFYATAITHKAIDLLSPKPTIQYQYVTFNGKKLYAIKVEKSDHPVTTEGKLYVRVGSFVRLSNSSEVQFKPNGYPRIEGINQQILDYKKKSTSAKFKLLEHYQSILKIIDDVSSILCPLDANTPTDNQEGRILSRILFSSFVDNFETYLSDLLYEIFLAIPATLKSDKTVTLKEVLDCSDLQEFVKMYSKKIIGKLQRGSIKSFLEDTNQIADLKVIDKIKQDEIDKIFQIRHLYSHRNGIVDEKFLRYFTGQFQPNSEHKMSVNDICDNLCDLAEIANKIDEAAIAKYRLDEVS
jgi:Putative DNA-binding domain